MHTYIICIGSNYNRKENLFLARHELMVLFPDIRFGCERETKPFLLKNTDLFSNQVAVFKTNMDIETACNLLKDIEKKAGRKPEHKAQEKVLLDIDILVYDDTVIKVEDMGRDFIIEGIKELVND